jgi:hypothetical protein
MRYWQFGIFDSQAADFDCDSWSGCRSIISLADNTADQEAGVFHYNTELSNVSGYVPGTNPLHAVSVVNIAIAQIKAKLGQIPVLIRADLGIVSYETETNQPRVYRMYKTWEIGDSSNRYWDRTATEPWYEDTYAPFAGQDRETVPSFDTGSAVQLTATERYFMTITNIVERALRDNTDIMCCLWYKGNTSTFYWKPTVTTYRPTIEFFYLYPIEFYEDSGGNLDYSSAIQEFEDGHYYIGAVERGQTGVAVKGWIRNYSGQTQQVELFDDHPEWTTPTQRVGSGTGKLDIVKLADNAVSQKYEPVFYSSTEYEIRATAYRDNAVSLHPTINADASWRGDTSTLFTAPSGGFSIPADAWQPGTLLNDEFEIGVRGNTTDSSWAADSNDQVEITFDNAGVADATAWRPILGRRELTTASVDVDATSKFFPLRHLVPADWPVSTPCFIQDQSNIDEGTITSVQERALGTESFTGGGLDDMSDPTGNYNGNGNRAYRIQIDANGTPDTFSWSRDGTTSWVQTGVDITSSPTLLEDGIYLDWNATTGHTIGDYWLFDADTWGVTVGSLTSGSNSYASGASVGTTLPIRDLTAAVFASVSEASGASESPASRLYLDDTSGFTQGDTIFVQQVDNQGIFETATIATGGVQSEYLDLTASLTNDYGIGDFCTKQGAGEEPFWMRPVATSTTVEELKRLRLNARML